MAEQGLQEAEEWWPDGLVANSGDSKPTELTELMSSVTLDKTLTSLDLCFPFFEPLGNPYEEEMRHCLHTRQ